MHLIYLKHEFHTLSWITEINFHDILIFWDAPVCQVCHPEICLCDIYAKTYNIDILKVLIDWNIVKANILAFFLIVASAGSSFSCFFFDSVPDTGQLFWQRWKPRNAWESKLPFSVFVSLLSLFNSS